MPIDDINFVSMLEQGGKGPCDSPSVSAHHRSYYHDLTVENSPLYVIKTLLKIKYSSNHC